MCESFDINFSLIESWMVNAVRRERLFAFETEINVQILEFLFPSFKEKTSEIFFGKNSCPLSIILYPLKKPEYEQES